MEVKLAKKYNVIKLNDTIKESWIESSNMHLCSSN